MYSERTGPPRFEAADERPPEVRCLVHVPARRVVCQESPQILLHLTISQRVLRLLVPNRHYRPSDRN